MLLHWDKIILILFLALQPCPKCLESWQRDVFRSTISFLDNFSALLRDHSQCCEKIGRIRMQTVKEQHCELLWYLDDIISHLAVIFSLALSSQSSVGTDKRGLLCWSRVGILHNVCSIRTRTREVDVSYDRCWMDGPWTLGSTVKMEIWKKI